MRHFVQYHNSETIGYPASKLTEPKIFTNKSVRGLSSNAVWLISGEGLSPNKEFYLAAAFKVKRVSAGCREHPDFANAAFGDGHIFGEVIRLNDYAWFQDFKSKLQNFRGGLTSIEDAAVISNLRSLAGPHAV